jgi:hypothetical protein
MAAPIPLDAPVTTATLPLSLLMFVSLCYCECRMNRLLQGKMGGSSARIQ